METESTVFSTPWFDLIAKNQLHGAPHYSIRTCDYVLIVCITAESQLVLVQQYRPAIGIHVLELPAGHVEANESPEEAARKELLEETGFTAPHFELLGKLAPDPGRLQNSMWCFFAAGAVPVPDAKTEMGIERHLYAGSVMQLLAEPKFVSALNLAALFLAIAQGFLSVGNAEQPGPQLSPPGEPRL